MQDSELLRAYAADGDEAAFTELAGRYLDLVYSAALRQLQGNSHLAEEVAQAVFLLLAKKAGDLVSHPALAGWLYRATHHFAEKARRTESRRVAREQIAVQMNSSSPNELHPEEILPLLEEALHALSEADRRALLLRFFMKKPMRDVGLAFGVSEAAAKMRVGRAVERLRDFFARHGVTCSSAALAAILMQNTVRAAPRTLLPTIIGRLSQLESSAGGAAWTTKTLLLMSQTKTTTIILGLAALFTISIGVRHFVGNANPKESPSSGPDRAADKGVVPASVPKPSKVAAALRAGAASDITSARVERLRAALAAPLPKSGISWPSEEVIQAVAAFSDKRAAFDALKEVVLHAQDLVVDNLGVGDPAGMIRDRAISAMTPLAGEVPEVAPFLRELLRSDDVPTAISAFMDLQSIGLRADDLPTLWAQAEKLGGSPAVRRCLPQGIADLLASNPQAAAAIVPTIASNLSSPDEQVRLSAACALVTSRLEDPRVSKLLKDSLAPGDPFQERLAMEALAKAGPKAAEFVPDLLELAKNTTDSYLRKDTLRAIATIQPAAAGNTPEVAQVLADDSAAQDLGNKLSKNGASVDDLLGALRLPQYSAKAAAQLADLGPAAAKALPALAESLDGKDEDARDKIVQAMLKIDPATRIERVDGRVTADAVMSAEIALGARGNDYQDPLTKLLMERRAFSTWWTRDEVVSFAKKLNAMDPAISQAFVDKVVEKDPGMRAALVPRE
jgi:RNA polymerase sigma factor (sigma-70 family)